MKLAETSGPYGLQFPKVLEDEFQNFDISVQSGLRILGEKYLLDLVENECNDFQENVRQYFIQAHDHWKSQKCQDCN